MMTSNFEISYVFKDFSLTSCTMIRLFQYFTRTSKFIIGLFAEYLIYVHGSGQLDRTLQASYLHGKQ